MDTRDIYKLVRELSEDRDDVINLYDSMDIELSEGFVIETGVVGFTKDGVIVHLDEDAMEFLDFNGVLLESEDLKENQDSVDAVCNAILNRIARQHPDVLQKFGPQVVMYAAEDVAEFAADGGLDEIGSSDVSIWTKQVIQDLEAGQYAHLNENPALMALGRAAAMGAGSELAGRIADKIGIEEGSYSAVDVFKGKLSSSNDPFEMIYNAISGDYGEEIRNAFQEMYDDVVNDSGYRLHPDDDFEKIIDTIVDQLVNDSRIDVVENDELALIKKLALGESAEEIDEGLGKALLAGAALIASLAGINKMEADHLMKTQPQLVTLTQMRQEAVQAGDEYKVKEIDERIKKTLDFISVKGRPVMGPDGPVDPREPVGEAEYQGRKVPLGKPMQGDVAKSKVYVKKPNGKVVKVNFGDKNMTIKKNNPARRKSFRARHNCDNPGPRWKARYWSCRAW
jgi:hypothetical protein